jgi:hypothetical protein
MFIVEKCRPCRGIKKKRHFTLVRMATIKKTQRITVIGGGEDGEKLEFLCVVSRNAKGCRHCEKEYGSFLKN